jgi:hypothetical protein
MIVFTIEEITNGYLLKTESNTAKQPLLQVAGVVAQVLDIVSAYGGIEAIIKEGPTAIEIIIKGCIEVVQQSELFEPKEPKQIYFFEKVEEIAPFLTEYMAAE